MLILNINTYGLWKGLRLWKKEIWPNVETPIVVEEPRELLIKVIMNHKNRSFEKSHCSKTIQWWKCSMFGGVPHSNSLF